MCKTGLDPQTRPGPSLETNSSTGTGCPGQHHRTGGWICPDLRLSGGVSDDGRRGEACSAPESKTPPVVVGWLVMVDAKFCSNPPTNLLYVDEAKSYAAVERSLVKFTHCTMLLYETLKATCSVIAEHEKCYYWTVLMHGRTQCPYDFPYPAISRCSDTRMQRCSCEAKAKQTNS